jgi:hypothetical protein
MTADEPDTDQQVAADALSGDGPDADDSEATGGNAAPDAEVPRCWNCGEPLPEGAMFCGECGSAVGARSPAQLSPDQNDAGSPPHGDALLETPVEPSGDEVVVADADAEPLPPPGVPRTEWVAPAEVVEAAAEIVAEEQAESGDAPGESDASGDREPTLGFSAVADDDSLDAPDDSDQAESAEPGEKAGLGGEAGLGDEAGPADGVDDLAPLTPEERFAAARLLDPESQADRFVLQFSTGESATVYGAGLIGRNPVAEPGEYVDHLVVLRDPGRSVSKTHLEFGQDAGSFWVLDRFSGNGSVLREPDAAPKRLEPGRRFVVPRGSRVEIGDQFFVVS